MRRANGVRLLAPAGASWDLYVQDWRPGTTCHVHAYSRRFSCRFPCLNAISEPLSGRTAVVTGASSGIGEASAEHLAALGARVVVLARRADRLGDLVARIEKNGGSALATGVYVTDTAAVRTAADRVAAELGGADLLFNNAGVMLPAPVEELATDQWQQAAGSSTSTSTSPA